MIRPAFVLPLLLSASLAASSTAPSARVRQDPAARLPLAFQENRGQVNPDVTFFAQRGQDAVFVTADSLTFSTPARNIRMRFPGSIAPGAARGEVRLPGDVNWLVGSDPSTWHAHVPLFARVRMPDLYPGIDLVLHEGAAGGLEYDLVVHPGADPSCIRLAFEGVDGTALTPSGDLALLVPGASVLQQLPAIYQVDGSRMVPVEGRQRRLPSGEIAIDVGSHDPSRDLVVDPTIAISTYLGGSSFEAFAGIAVDAAGCRYVTGTTQSPEFPTTGSLGSPGPPGGFNTIGFVTKLTPSGDAIVYSTFFPAIRTEIHGIAVDSTGHAVVVGATGLADFPILHQIPGVPPPPGYYGNEGFVFRLDPSGSSFVYSTYIGGDGQVNSCDAVATDAAGDAYVTGNAAPDMPVRNPFQATFAGDYDGFVAKIPPEGGSLTYATYLGGAGDEVNEANVRIALGAGGVFHVAAITSSTDFPVIHAYQPVLGGEADVFVTTFAP
jgi:hypothetical protein